MNRSCGERRVPGRGFDRGQARKMLFAIGPTGYPIPVSSDVEIDRALATVTATVNDQGLSEFDAGRVQQIVTRSLGGEPLLTVDDGGGLHDETGARVGIIRRTGSGEWIAERQNDAAERSRTAVPTQPPWSRLRKLLTMLHVRG
jgi:hypothetical protein